MTQVRSGASATVRTQGPGGLGARGILRRVRGRRMQHREADHGIERCLTRPGASSLHPCRTATPGFFARVPWHRFRRNPRTSTSPRAAPARLWSTLTSPELQDGRLLERETVQRHRSSALTWAPEWDRRERPWIRFTVEPSLKARRPAPSRSDYSACLLRSKGSLCLHRFFTEITDDPSGSGGDGDDAVRIGPTSSSRKAHP